MMENVYQDEKDGGQIEFEEDRLVCIGHYDCPLIETIPFHLLIFFTLDAL